MSAVSVLHGVHSRADREVSRFIPLIQDGWVLFDLNEYRQNDTGPWEEPGPLTADERERLDARWREVGLTGATLVVRCRIQPLVEPIICLDDDLIVNVLLRTRDDLLVHGMPLLDGRGLTSSAVLVPEPRLRDHIVASGRYRVCARRWGA